MSDMTKKKPGNTPVQAAWIGIKARHRAQKGAVRPQAEATAPNDSQSKRANGHARLFQLLSDKPVSETPARPVKTLKIQKVTTRASRERDLVRRHADAIEKIRARKALAAERDALVASVMEHDDFNFPAHS